MICIFLCVPFLIKAQNIEKLFSQANNLYQCGEFRDSRLAFERIVFTTRVNHDCAKAFFGKALCYKQQKQYNRAIEELNRVNFKGLPDSLQFEIRYEFILCAYLATNFNEALSQAKQLRFFIKDSTYHHKILFLEALTYNELTEWQNAESCMKKLITVKAPSDSAKVFTGLIAGTYNQRNYPKLKKVKKAKMLSTFIPGAGQIYAGYPFEGVFNLLLQSACLAGGVYGFYTKYYFTGYIVGFGLFQKFYFGGTRRAELLANKTNYKRIRKFNDNAKHVILRIAKNCK